MIPKLLTESGWKVQLAKFKVKDNGLQRALATYEKLPEEKFADRLKALATVSQLAGNLKRSIEKDKAMAPAVTYLTQMISAAAEQKKPIEASMARALADDKKQNAQQKAAADGYDEQGDYPAKLLAAISKLRATKGLSFEFLACEAKPFLAVIVAKKINPKHKEELTQVTGGGKTFLPIGQCHVTDAKLHFVPPKPVGGLARRIQDSIKHFTGKKFAVVVGNESVGDQDAPVAGSDSPLAQAPATWIQTRGRFTTNLEQLKAAVLEAFLGEAPKLVADLQKKVSKFDGLIAKLDQSLADSITRVNGLQDPPARKKELAKARTILAGYRAYVKSQEKFIAQIDANPFGVRINLRQELNESLNQVAKAIN